MAEGSGIAVTILGTQGRGEPCGCTKPSPCSGSGSWEFPWAARLGFGNTGFGQRAGNVCSLDCSQKGTLQPEVKLNCLKA